MLAERVLGFFFMFSAILSQTQWALASVSEARSSPRRARRPRDASGIMAACHRSTLTSSRRFAVSAPRSGPIEVLEVLDHSVDQDQAATHSDVSDLEGSEPPPRQALIGRPPVPPEELGAGAA
jgi:hypothetical protein